MTQAIEQEIEIDDQEEQTAEDRAKAMGWKPKENYKGPEDKWVEAEEFVRRADEDPKEARKANHALMRKLQKLEQGQDDLIAHQQRELVAARQQEYARAQADIRRNHDAAIAEGDVEKAGKAWTAAEALTQQQINEARAPAVTRMAGDDAAILAAWKEDNDWYGSNYKATQEANAYEDWLAKQGKPLAQRLKMTAEYIKNEVLESPKRRDEAPSAVYGQNNNGAIRNNRKAKPGTYEALTQAARAECDRVVRGGRVSKEMWLQFALPEHFQQ